MFQLIGELSTGVMISNLLYKFYPYLIPFKFTLWQLQAQDQNYVMITGSSDGLGKTFIRHFIALKYNLILHARNKQKIEDVILSLEGYQKISENSFSQSYDNKTGLKIVVILQDYANLDKEQQTSYTKNLEMLIQTFQIKTLKYLINNAGSTEVNLLQNTNFNELISVNCISTILNSQFALKNFQSVKIINMSSFVGGLYPSGYLSVYGGTKSFVQTLNKSISEETFNKVQTLTLTPYYISTKMTRYQKPQFDTITPEDFVRNSLKLIVSGKLSGCGHWQHELLNLFYKTYPWSLTANKRMLFMAKVQKVFSKIKLR